MSIVDQVIDEIKSQFEGDATGHDWYHIERVLNLSRFIQLKEGGDLLVIELSALLHDISDHKFNGGKLNEGGIVASEILGRLDVENEIIERVKYIVDNVSYKGAKTKSEMNCLEGKIVQDADRLDAIGAIGIARTFAYGGHKNQAIYDPKMNATLHKNFSEYANAKTNTINHFHEKLLLLKNRLNTKTGQSLGKKRHELMESFLNSFMEEWNFNKIN